MMRSIETCRHRRTSRTPAVPARCDLVDRITGLGEGDPGGVPRDACAVCCRGPEPSEVAPNPVIASLVFGVARQAESEGGLPGLDPDRADRLKAWSARRLLRVRSGAPAGDFVSPQPHPEPCFHLGEPTGLFIACSGCRPSVDGDSSVRLKVFRCRHPLHRETTIRQCRTCPDHDAILTEGPGAVRTWAVGVTTAPRTEPTLERTLESLARAGWDEVRVFAEPGVVLPPRFARLPVSRRDARLGEWPNWFLALSELYQRQPHADAYFLVQDDVVFARGTRAFLEARLWPAPRLALLSPYCPEPYARETFGWHPVDAGRGLIGALTYLIPNAAARALMGHPAVIAHRRTGERGLLSVDAVAGGWARLAGWPVLYHSPSLAQHIGDTSTIWPGAMNSGTRHSSNFVGEDCDAVRLIGHEAGITYDLTRIEPPEFPTGPATPLDPVALNGSIRHRPRDRQGSIRVGFLSPVFGLGGVETWHSTLLAALDPARVEIAGLVILNMRDGASADLDRVRDLGVPVERGPSAAQNLARNVDVLISWGIADLGRFLPPQNDPARPFVIQVIHGDDSLSWTSEVASAVAPEVDRYVAVSESALAPIPPARRADAVVILNGLDPLRLQRRTPRTVVRAREEAEPEDRVVLHLGRIVPERQPDVLVLALARLPERYVGWFAGEGPDVARLIDLAARVGLRPTRLRFLGARRDVGDLLGAADVLINPSPGEGFGYAVAEALACGLPVVGTPSGFVESRRWLIETVSSSAPADEWARTLRRAAEPDDAESHALRVRAARRFARTQLTAERFADRWMRLIDECVRTASDPSRQGIGQPLDLNT